MYVAIDNKCGRKGEKNRNQEAKHVSVQVPDQIYYSRNRTINGLPSDLLRTANQRSPPAIPH